MSPKAIQWFIDNKALFVINHSGGKDSQAMTIYLRSIIPAELLVVITKAGYMRKNTHFGAFLENRIEIRINEK